MSDINNYAGSLLLDFVDNFHECMKETLVAKYGTSWLDKGVKNHFKADYFERTKRMLSNPMRVVDMEKTDEDLYGIEHLSTIVLGNWSLFKDRLGNRNRTEVYLGEAAEMRHNLFHRRRRHILRRRELLRFVENCRLLLRALDSPAASRFESLADSLSQGGTPWGPGLAGSLPSSHEVVTDFVGRPRELRSLSEWLLGSDPQVLIFGYGGVGKSATAFQFARQVQDSGLEDLQAVCWASAKTREFVAGEERSRRPDFSDISSFASSVFATLYGAAPADASGDALLDELSSTPALVVVDDVDTVLHDQELAEFLLFRLRSTRSRVIFTSRNRVPGVPTIEISGFSEEELTEFVKMRARAFELDEGGCLDKLSAIAAVTGSYPLFTEDLLRYARLAGLKQALVEWQQRKGDAARSYALRRQLEQIGGAAQDTLIGIAVSSRPLTAIEIASISASTDDDVENSIRDLEAWRLIDRVAAEYDAAPAFDMNANTRRLVMKTCSGDDRLQRYATAFRSLTGQKVPAAMRHAIGSAISVAKSMVMRNDIEGAISHINDAMKGDLKQSADLHGALGWICSRKADSRLEDARTAFQRAHDLGSRSRDTYFHWARLEAEVAESTVGEVEDSDLLKSWQSAARVAKLGVERCGDSRGLCQLAGYAHGREARTLEHLNQFAAAQGAHSESRTWSRRAIDAPDDTADSGRDAAYRGLILALAGLNDQDELAKAFVEWAQAEGESSNLLTERERLCQKYPDLSQLIQDCR